MPSTSQEIKGPAAGDAYGVLSAGILAATPPPSRQAGTAPSAQSGLAPTSEGWGRKRGRGQGAANPSPTHNAADEPRKRQNPVSVDSGGGYASEWRELGPGEP